MRQLIFTQVNSGVEVTDSNNSGLPVGFFNGYCEITFTDNTYYVTSSGAMISFAFNEVLTVKGSPAAANPTLLMAQLQDCFNIVTGGGGGGGGNVVVTASVLPTNAAQETGGNLAAIVAKLPSQGQALMAASQPVVIASNQSAVPVSASALPLPTNAAQETGGNLAAAAASLAAIDAGIPTSLGQKTSAASMPVVLASDQSAVPVSASALPLPTNAAQETGGNLAAIVAKLPSQGQALMAASQPVVIASNQSAIPTYNPDQNVSGTITSLNGSVVLNYSGVSSAYATISGTWSGSIQYQGLAADGVTWLPLNAATGGPTNPYVTTALTVNGSSRIALPAGFKGIRAYSTAWSSGTATININVSLGVSDVEAIQLNASNFNATVIGGVTSVLPSATNAKVQVVQTPQKSDYTPSFDKVLASTVDSAYWNTLAIGAGQSISQASGTMVLTSGTTINSETMIRSLVNFQGPFCLKYSTVLSQRIANNNFYVEMVDLLGDSLSITVNSATSVTVTVPSTTLDSTAVGKSIYIGNLAGFTGVTSVPGRYPIASISGTAITFTVAGWATGSVNTGTCTLFGYNYHQILYTSTTATNASYQTQRNGWANGAVTATINTSASPGHLGIATMENGASSYSDQLTASGTTVPTAMRAQFIQLLPDPTITLYLQIRSVNGTTAPASTTTWTISTVRVENYVSQPVSVSNVTPQSDNTPLPVSIFNATGVTPGVNIAQLAGTAPVTGGVAGIQAVGGNIAAGTARTANPLGIGGVDINNLVRNLLTSVIGQPYVAGPGESITQFSVGTGAAAVTDGTNGKTIFVQNKESDVYMEISAISTSPTIQLEGSYDNQLFFIIPLTRVDNTAASAQYPQTVATSTITPVAGALYRGKTYGCPILRVHLVAGSASNTIGTVRVVPAVTEPGVTASPFGLVLANTTESVGVANGQLFQQGVRTLIIPSRGSAKVQLVIDAMTWTGTMSAGIQVVVEGLNDSASTTWNALTLQPLAGGSTVTTITGPATAFSVPYSGVWEADLGANGYNQVRVRLSNVGTGGTAPLVLGGLRIIPAVSNQGLGTGTKTTFTAAVSGISATTTNNLIVIESGAAKRTTIRKIYFTPGTATAASLINLTVYRETSASSGGATQTPSGRQSSDSFSGIVRITNPTLGTNAATNIVFPIPTAIAASVYSTPFVYDFTNGGTEPGLVLPIGTANGVAFQTAGATGGAGAGLLVEFTEE